MHDILLEQDRLRREREIKLRQRIKSSEQAKQRRERLKAEGRCTRCGRITEVEGQTLCQSCAEDQKKATQRLREKKRARGECMFCSSPALPGRVLCERCLERNRRNYYKRRDGSEVQDIE